MAARERHQRHLRGGRGRPADHRDRRSARRELFARADEVIGYNVGFDLGFLSAVGVRPREDSIITDTMFLFKQLMGRRYKLTDAADHIGYEWTGRAHGSLADALATLAVQEWLESR